MPTVLNLGSLNVDYVYQMERFLAPGETLALGAGVSVTRRGAAASIPFARELTPTLTP